MPRPSTQTIHLFGGIGDQVTAEGVRQQLAALNPAAPLLVEINSEGGAVQEAAAIYSMLRAWPGGVDVDIVGWALSAATVIAMAGRTVRMGATSLMMVHAPWVNASGNAAELRGVASTLDAVAASMRTAYARTRQKPAVIDGWLDGSDHWFTSDQALAVGLADALIPTAASAFANASLRTVPAHLSAYLSPAMTTPTTTPPTTPQTAAPHDVAAIRAEAHAAGIRAESARRVGIQAVFQPVSSREGMAEVQAACLADPTVTEDIARERILARMGQGLSSIAGSYMVEVGSDSAADFRAAARDALLIRAGHPVKQPHPGARDLRHMSMVTIAETMLSRRGHAFTSRSAGDVIEAAMSTADFPGLLADVANKSLLMGYALAPITYGEWTAEKDVPDFKPTTLAMLSEAPALEKVIEYGEYKYGQLSDSATTFKVETFGKILKISRQAIINDDLGALAAIPATLGAASRRLEADGVYSVLNDNPDTRDGLPLFHAQHGNLASVPGLPSLETLAAARSAMRRQKGIAGLDYIDPQPRFLIVPVALETVAEVMLNTLANPSKGDSVAPEWVRGLKLISDPRLDAASVTAWYLAADPRQIETVVRAYLSSEQRPFIGQNDEWVRDVTSFKVRLDFGVGVIDYRGLYKNAGA